MQNECPAFHSEILTLMVFSQAGNETEQSVNIHIWGTSFICSGSVQLKVNERKKLFSLFPKINTAATQCYIPSLCWLSTGVATGHTGLTL